MNGIASASPSVLLIGGPDAGKSNYLFRLWLAVDEGAGALIKNGFPDELEYLRNGLESLLKGKFAGRTSKEALEHVSIPVQSSKDPSRTGVLNVPDVPGERILRIYRSREWDSLWEDRIQEGCGCLIFIRAGSSEIVRPLDHAECLKLYGATLKAEQGEAPQKSAKVAELANIAVDEPINIAEQHNEADGKDAASQEEAAGAPEPPTDVVLTDWLQFLRRAFTDRVSGAYRPRVGIVVAAWDGVPNDRKTQPPLDYLAENFPLFRQFVETNDDHFNFQVFGLSILGGDLKKDKDFREAFTKGKPNEFGYTIHSLNGKLEKTADVTIPVAWALEWFQPTLPPETKP